MVLRNGFLVQIILPDDVLLKKKKLYIFPPSLLCALVSASSVLGLVMSRKLPFQLYRVFFFSSAIRVYYYCFRSRPRIFGNNSKKMNTSTEKITINFNTSRFGVKVADGSFDPTTTIGEVHARLRKKLMKAKATPASPGVSNDASVTAGGAASGNIGGGGAAATYVFVRNGTEAFIPAPEQTLQTLLDLYAAAPEQRKLYVTIDPEIFSG